MHVYIMVDFICMGLVELRGLLSKGELENEQILVHSGTQTHARHDPSDWKEEPV